MFDVQNNHADLSTWWQSVTWYYLGRTPVVTISLSFGKTFQLQDDVVVVFKSARPQEMVLEKSVDFGQTWSPLQYYNRQCRFVRLPFLISLLSQTANADGYKKTQSMHKQHNAYAHKTVLL